MAMCDIKLTLPDGLAREAEANGLLTPETLERLLREELRRRRVNHLLRRQIAWPRSRRHHLPAQKWRLKSKPREGHGVPPMRVVADIDTIISGLLWQGPPRSVVDAARAGSLDLF
jgi:hypothetical protein